MSDEVSDFENDEGITRLDNAFLGSEDNENVRKEE